MPRGFSQRQGAAHRLPEPNNNLDGEANNRRYPNTKTEHLEPKASIVPGSGSLSLEIPTTTLLATDDMASIVELDANQAQMNITDLEEAIRGLKLSYIALEMENRELKAQLAQYQCESKKSKNSTGDRSSKKVRSQNDYTQLCRRLVICYDMMLNQDAFLKPKPSLEGSVRAKNHPDRYKTPERRQMGQTDELYEVMPAAMHTLLATSPEFKTNVMTTFHEVRRSILTAFRAKIAYRAFPFLNPPPGIYDSIKGPERGENIAFRDFIHPFPKANNPSQLSLYRPCMFPKRRMQGAKMFLRCDWFAWTLRGMAFGPTSMPDTQNPSSGGTIASNSAGHIWGLSELTPGFIGLAVVATIFCHSSDIKFAEVGGESGINYCVIFSFIKQYVTEKLEDPASGMKETVEYLSSIVFKNAKNKSSGSDEVEQVIADGLADLNLLGGELYGIDK
ncbi:hypothetical protein FA15DRAFT_694885 [Coprinopsis marcescibilis]|uniref:Uncharacterized protein n=1 Tax=Coprinopsis marcescibilis TaxID=230819 RepID=A0A5C3KTA6_COPMA|nr:hypothetical protein FA15DRAFT_694885 [Coprinopsis marcescibilis]